MGNVLILLIQTTTCFYRNLILTEPHWKWKVTCMTSVLCLKWKGNKEQKQAFNVFPGQTASALIQTNVIVYFQLRLVSALSAWDDSCWCVWCYNDRSLTLMCVGPSLSHFNPTYYSWKGNKNVVMQTAFVFFWEICKYNDNNGQWMAVYSMRYAVISSLGASVHLYKPMHIQEDYFWRAGHCSDHCFFLSFL